jgi:hypothetical protein
MKIKYHAFLFCLLLACLTINRAVSQSFKPVVPDSGTAVIYMLRDPSPVGGAVPWPLTVINRTLYNCELNVDSVSIIHKENKIRLSCAGLIIKQAIKKGIFLTKLKQKEYIQLTLIPGNEYFIDIGWRYLLYNGESGSSGIISLKGVNSEIQCLTGEINYKIDPEWCHDCSLISGTIILRKLDILMQDLKTAGINLKSDSSSCKESLSRMAKYKQNLPGK